MVEKIQRRISESRTARWVVLLMVSLTMMCGYFLTDVLAPLKGLLIELFHWDNTDFGLFNSGYGWFNVFLLMLIFGGMVLDKMGARFTGVLSVGVMLVGIGIKYYAIEFMEPGRMVDFWFFGAQTMKAQVLTASLGYALFAVGYETIGITANKIVVRWFKGKELAFALGMNVAFARLGTFLALALPLPIAKAFGNSIGMPILFGMILLLLGFLTFLVYIVMDRRLDSERAQEGLGDDERFRFRDIFSIFRIRAFWYIALLCLLFYAAVHPFVKFAVDLVVQKFGVAGEYSGLIPSLLPVGTLVLTPLFGSVYDRRGKGASMMIWGAMMLVLVYAGFSMPWITHWAAAAVLVIILGVAFSLVPSAMWPSVPKIIPEHELGTAYALIFWVQNWGLAGVPLLIGWALDRWGTLPAEITEAGATVVHYDYTVPMLIFLCLGLLAVLFGFLLKREDKKKGYGLQKPNIEK
ncbi:MFS transporter [uncultured Rikenella sp.]|uniref:MFS transporter n=1 Tax=uncultured Rikenella sp. TaxID=368003 RepID=UPI00262B291F|nr:MFS transporter [uncultured Rikenella sp.]